jgi:alkylation response protein AidB-like acyl-CoA dehydrogenase
MDLEPDESQAALRDELRRFLTDRVTPEARRAAADRPGAVDRALWSELATMGTFTLALPEDAGGVGLGWADAVLAFGELGRAAVPGPLVPTALAAALAPGLVPGADGGAVVGAVDAVGGPALVEHLAGLDALVVVGPDGLRSVDAAALAAESVELPRPLDPLTPVSRVARLDGWTAAGDRAAADRWRLVGALLVAALQVGLGDGAVAMGTDYARQRRQFGREIGSFQAVKHMLADAYTGVEVARSAVWSAAVHLDESLAEGTGDDASVARAVAGARVMAASASVAAAKVCIQVHGGTGFTWELDAHLYLKRALVLDSTFGSVDASLATVAAAL